MKIQSLKLSEKPALFADYLSNFAKVESFFAADFRGDWQEVINRRANVELPRPALADALLAQNKRWNAPEASLQNIDKLRDLKTLAVVTGQQAGVLGGPLYTFYKTITIIKLAGALQKKYPDFQFVPVFWMEVNDSDFPEINHIQYITKENQLKELAAGEAAGDENKPINMRKVSAEIQGWRAQFEEDFFDTEFKNAALDAFLGEYHSENSYADAFARMLLKFFGKHGLVVLNPAGNTVSALVAPLFQRTLEDAEQILKVAAKRRKTLEAAGYPTQIHFSHNQTLLFFNDAEHRRVRIDFDGDGQFLLKYPDGYRPVDHEKLLKSCEDSPEYLSPNVALRPLMQDSLLPTVAYVGGPSEVAYFAQVEALYRYFEMPMPVIVPRHRVTIIEGKIQKIIDKNELDDAGILENRPDFIEHYIRNHASQDIYRAVETTEARISQSLQTLLKMIKDFDPTLENSVDKTRQNIEGSFGKLSNKITRSLEQKNEVQVRQLERMLLYLLPNHHYQERVLNMIYFCVKYGVSFVDELLEALPAETDSHHVIKL